VTGAYADEPSDEAHARAWRWLSTSHTDRATWPAETLERVVATENAIADALWAIRP